MMHAGDMKFLNSLMGLNGCASTYPCIYCKVHSSRMHLLLSQRRTTSTVDGSVTDLMPPRTIDEGVEHGMWPITYDA